MRSLVAALALFISFAAFGQSKTYLGIELSLANDIYKLKDNGGYMKTIPLRNFPIAIQLRQDLNKKFFGEVEVMFKYYYEGFGFKEVPHNSSSSDDISFLIPFRFGTRFNLYKEKLYFAPVLGYTIGIAPSFGSGIAYGNSQSGSTNYEYTYSENPNVDRYFSLIQTGAGIEYTLFENFIFSFSANHYAGLNSITQLDIYYTVNQSSPIAGTATGKGSFWALTTSIKYPVSNLWTRK